MRSTSTALLLLCAGTALSGPGGATEPPDGTRGDPIPIGVFLPARGPEAALGREVLRGAEIAVARANRAGGVGGRPLRLVAAASDLLWEASTRELVRLIYEEGTVAILGPTDARTSHLAEQVITRARGQAILLTPWASETTLTRIRIPWFFRIVPDDRRQAEVLAREIFSVRGARRAAAWTEDSFESRSAAEAFLRAAPPGRVERFEADREGSRRELADRIGRRGIDALVLLASPRVSADLALWLRGGGHRVEIFGTLALAGPEFLTRAGEAAEGILLVATGTPRPADGSLGRFRREFRRAYGNHPTLPALFSHDAVAVLVEAMREAGPESGDRLAEVLAETSIPGLTGCVRFDRRRDRDLEPALSVVRGGHLVPPGPAPENRQEEEG